MPAQPRVCEKRILLVEDDPAARQSIKLLLMIDRHQVTEAENSRDAFRVYAPNRFDLVLMDYFMPDVQGDQLAAALRQVNPAQRMVMVTAYAEKLVDRNLPVDAILPKPFGIEELRQAIAQALS